MKEEWESIWREYRGLNFLGRQLKKHQFKVLKKIIDELELKKDSRIIDVGCGSGFTLSFFKTLGFTKSVGTNFSENSIKVSEKNFDFKKGKDLFVMDVQKMGFENNFFDMVFSDGMLEHFEDFNSAAREMTRISKKYILLFQPNQTSIFGRLKDLFFRLGKVSWDKEYPHPEGEYLDVFQKLGYQLRKKGSIHFREQFWLLFEKQNQ